MKLRNFRVDVSFEDSKAFRGTTYWQKYWNSREPSPPAAFSAFIYGVRSRESAYRIVTKCHASRIHRAGYTGPTAALTMRAVEIRKDGQEFGKPAPKNILDEPILKPRKNKAVKKKSAKKSRK